MPNATTVWSYEKDEIGYKSGSGANKFNQWYNNNIGNIGNYAWAWCQAFQSWGFDSAGVEYPRTAHCQTAVNWWKSKGRFSRTPQIGDQIFYDWGDGGMADHVGFVSDLNGSTVFTIEGNTGAWPGQVAQRSYPRGSGYILGYGHPNYDGSSVALPSANAEESTDAPSGYVVTKTDGLNWRSAPTTDSDSVASYGCGSTVQCVGWVYGQDPYQTGENRWVKSAARGLYAWAGGVYSLNGLDNIADENTSSAVEPIEDEASSFWVTCSKPNIWRESPDKGSKAIYTYNAGAQILCSEKITGTDPYGDGRNIWYKSERSGLYCWQGTIE